jgi:hypothetical protein
LCIHTQCTNPFRCNDVGSGDFASLLAWLQSKGVDTSKVEVASYGDAGNGLRAKAPLKKGELFLVVPEAVMMTTNTVASSSVAKFVAEDPLVSEMPNVQLALHALTELGRGAASPWAPYLATLPRSCVECPSLLHRQTLPPDMQDNQTNHSLLACLVVMPLIFLREIVWVGVVVD